MRKMPHMHRSYFAPADLVNPNDVGWSIDTHVYPDTVAIVAGERGAVLASNPDGGHYATADRWVIKGVGVYTIATVHQPDGSPLASTDMFVPDARIGQWGNDAIAVLNACGQANADLCERLHTYFYRLLVDTARCVMWAWWNDHKPESDSSAWAVYNSLTLRVVPGVRGGMPLGIEGSFRDLRQPLAFGLLS